MKSEHLKHIAKVAFWWTQGLLKSKKPFATKEIVLRNTCCVFNLRAKLCEAYNGDNFYDITINFNTFNCSVRCYLFLGFDDDILKHYNVRTMEHVIENGLLKTIDELESDLYKLKELRNDFCKLKEDLKLPEEH